MALQCNQSSQPELFGLTAVMVLMRSELQPPARKLTHTEVFSSAPA